MKIVQMSENNEINIIKIKNSLIINIVFCFLSKLQCVNASSIMHYVIMQHYYLESYGTYILYKKINHVFGHS
jgi:hypothetical protein